MKTINKTSWKDIPSTFKQFHALMGFSPPQIIGKYNCLRTIKSGDIVRFMNSNYRNNYYSFSKMELNPLPFYSSKEELIYFNAVCISHTMERIATCLSGYFMIPDTFSIKEYHGNDNLSYKYHRNKLYKDDFDLKLIEQLLKKWTGNYFWTDLTNSSKPFFPIQILKHSNAKY